MRNVTTLLLKFICIAILFVIPFCKKGNQSNGCEASGGTGIGGVTPTYKFWTKIAMYNTTIELKDKSGTLVDSKIMTGYYLIDQGSPIEPDPCKQETGPAIFSLSRGTHYSYKATNGSKTWTGTIDVPCSPSQCYNVEIK